MDAARIANGTTPEQRARYLTDAPYHARVTMVNQAVMQAIDQLVDAHTIDPADTLMFAIAAVDALEAFDAQAGTQLDRRAMTRPMPASERTQAKQSGISEPEYRVRILVEVVLLPDELRRASRGDADERAVRDACVVKSYLEDPQIQESIDEAGSRGRIIGASVVDVRRVDFADPLPIDAILAADLKRRVAEVAG